MRSFKRPDRKQLLLLTQVSLESVAPVGSALRCIDELVDQLDTTQIEENHDLEGEHGREPFRPKTLIAALSTQVVDLSREQEPVDFEVLAIDSVKVRASASWRHCGDLQGIENVKMELAQETMRTAVSRERLRRTAPIVSPASSMAWRRAFRRGRGASRGPLPIASDQDESRAASTRCAAGDSNAGSCAAR